MIPVAIVGVTGYTGQELARLVAGHPELSLDAVFGSDARVAGQRLGDAAPALRGVVDLPLGAASADAIAATGARAIFLATPHEVSAALVPALRERLPGAVTADLSAAFRFADAAVYPAFYGFEHPAPALLADAVYGMPERAREGLAGATLIACAGCYVTAASIPLVALRRAGLISAHARPIIDATSGVSGAGRGGKPHTSFCEVALSPYGAVGHRHRPEIEQAVGTPVVFQPHLGAFARGILATTHTATTPGTDRVAIAETLGAAFDDEPFVRLLGDIGPGGSGTAPSVAAVERTNFIDIAWAFEPGTPGSPGHLTVFSAIDNLTKGAGGQAVQCVNAALGLPETLGLLPTAAKGATPCA